VAFARFWIFALPFGLSGTAAAREAIRIDFDETLTVMAANQAMSPVEIALRSVWERSMSSPKPAPTPVTIRQVPPPLPGNGNVTTTYSLSTQSLPCFVPSYRPTPWLAPQT